MKRFELNRFIEQTATDHQLPFSAVELLLNENYNEPVSVFNTALKTRKKRLVVIYDPKCYKYPYHVYRYQNDYDGMILGAWLGAFSENDPILKYYLTHYEIIYPVKVTPRAC